MCRELYFSAFNTEEEKGYPVPVLVLYHLVTQAHRAVVESQVPNLSNKSAPSASRSSSPACVYHGAILSVAPHPTPVQQLPARQSRLG